MFPVYDLYVPKLRRELGVASFIREPLGKPVASTAVLAARAEAFYAEIRRFAGQHGIPVVEFASRGRCSSAGRRRRSAVVIGLLVGARDTSCRTSPNVPYGPEGARGSRRSVRLHSSC